MVRFIRDPSWSPDGTKIAFRVVTNGNYGVYVVNSDGTGQKHLTFSAGDLSPNWSPDGTKIVYSSQNAPMDTLWIMNADGTGQTQLTNVYRDRRPSFGPQPPVEQSSLTVTSEDINGNAITGYWTVLRDGTNNNVLETGFTPKSFSLNSGQQYRIGVGNYDTYYFDHWLDTNSDVASRIISINSDTVLTAVYRTTPMPQPPPNTVTLTVMSQDMNGNTITGYWTVLYDGSAGTTVLKTGFTPRGFVLNPGQDYRVSMGNYGSYYFDHWLDTSSATNPRAVNVNSDTILTAVYRTTP